jgi:hypothetical protein
VGLGFAIGFGVEEEAACDVVGVGLVGGVLLGAAGEAVEFVEF